MNQSMLDQLQSVEMDVTVRFGFTEMPLREVASLGSGSLIELNRSIDEPVELLVNDFPFARGEVVVVDGYYSVKITEVSPADKGSNVFLMDALSTTTADDSAAANPDPVSFEPEDIQDESVQDEAPQEASADTTEASADAVPTGEPTQEAEPPAEASETDAQENAPETPLENETENPDNQ